MLLNDTQQEIDVPGRDKTTRQQEETKYNELNNK